MATQLRAQFLPTPFSTIASDIKMVFRFSYLLSPWFELFSDNSHPGVFTINHLRPFYRHNLMFSQGKSFLLLLLEFLPSLQDGILLSIPLVNFPSAFMRSPFLIGRI